MSYSFTMSFKEIEKEKLLDYISEITNICINNSKEIIKENIWYVPSLRIGNIFFSEDKELYTKCWAEADKNWLYSLFVINFVYWEDKNLLGICGCIPNVVKRELNTIYFQNSTDQDYDYNEWRGLSCFQSDIEKIKNMNRYEVLEYYNKNGDNYSENDLLDLDYHKKSLVYDMVFRKLDLYNWLYGKSGKFKRFSMSSITSQECLIKLFMILKAELVKA